MEASKFQNAYCWMIIAGCLNQAKRIVQKFDTVLHGAKPETLIEVTHEGIKDILQSPERGQFFLRSRQYGAREH